MSFLASLLAEKAKKGLIASCFYTTGFAGKDFTILPDLLDFLDADLIDVRFAPTAGTPSSGEKIICVFCWKADTGACRISASTFKRIGRIVNSELKLGNQNHYGDESQSSVDVWMPEDRRMSSSDYFPKSWRCRALTLKKFLIGILGDNLIIKFRVAYAELPIYTNSRGV